MSENSKTNLHGVSNLSLLRYSLWYCRLDIDLAITKCFECVPQYLKVPKMSDDCQSRCEVAYTGRECSCSNYIEVSWKHFQKAWFGIRNTMSEILCMPSSNAHPLGNLIHGVTQPPIMATCWVEWTYEILVGRKTMSICITRWRKMHGRWKLVEIFVVVFCLALLNEGTEFLIMACLHFLRYVNPVFVHASINLRCKRSE